MRTEEIRNLAGLLLEALEAAESGRKQQEAWKPGSSRKPCTGSLEAGSWKQEALLEAGCEAEAKGDVARIEMIQCPVTLRLVARLN